MGSALIYMARNDSPSSIVVRVKGRHYVAEFRDAAQADMSHGGIGPVVLTYEVVGRAYRTEQKAREDAVLALQRQEDRRGK